MAAVREVADKLERAAGNGRATDEAVVDIVRAAYAANQQVCFDGDNYAEDWHTEAEERGLANLRQTPDALPWLVEPATVEVFSHYDVLSERELESRYEVFLEQYTTTINIEGETAASIARTMLLPAAIQWLAALGEADGGPGVERLQEELSGLVDELVERIFALETANREYPETDDVLEGARYVQGSVIDAMASVREIADRLERIIPDDLWPLPKYSEVLFIK